MLLFLVHKILVLNAVFVSRCLKIINIWGITHIVHIQRIQSFLIVSNQDLEEEYLHLRFSFEVSKTSFPHFCNSDIPH